MENQKKQLPIKVEEGRSVPTYSNNVHISHTGEEFVLDFYASFPPQGSLINRIVISPAHAKRLTAALAQNIKNYEDKFQEIKEVPVKFDLNNIVTPDDEK